MDTPVLIPNTEVKHISGDNIWTGSSKDSTLPGNLTHHLMGLFFTYKQIDQGGTKPLRF